MKKLLYISILLLSCSKEKFDGAYWNTDRRPQVILISERYTNPPSLNQDLTWKPYKIVYDSLSKDIDYRSYENQKPDTIFSTCSIDKVDSSFKIEISYYKIANR